MNDMSTRLVAELASRPARFDADEFEWIMRAGHGLDIKLELAQGELERMSPPSNEHSARQTLVTYHLMALLGAVSTKLLRIELALRLDAETVRVPDLTLLRTPTDREGVLPGDLAELVVEIAEHSLAKDLGPKLREYAAAGIPNYWVVDGSAEVTHVYTAPGNGAYGRHAMVRSAEPLAVPGAGATITLA